MAVLNNSNAISSGGYDINNSLRFRSSATASLSRTPGTAGNRQKWTWSAWVKRGTLTAGALYFNGGTVGSNTYTDILDNGTALGLNNTISGTGLTISCKTAALFRDPSAWYHFVVAVDTTQATNSNGVKIYVNGVQQTLTFTDYTQNTNTQINNTVTQDIAQLNGYTSELFDGYMAEMHHIDGQQLTPSSFGETDTDTGSWKPKAYTGTYGTNGFYLKFSDIATTSGSNAGLGKDFSGNANYWTTNNISVTAGVTYDAMTDSPTLTSATVANYAVMNPLTGASTMTLLGGNLNTSSTAYGVHRYGTIGVSSGKWYWEASPTAMSGASNGMLVGISNDISETGATLVGIRGYLSGNGNKYTGSSGSAYGATWTTNDIMGMALDLDAGTLTFYKNNVSQGTAFTGLTGQWFPLIRTDATVTSFINFGQRPFAYTPPTGYVRLNTFNLPDSTIKKGNTVMDATLYTGNGTANTNITNTGSFYPSFTWIKKRSAAASHTLFDTIRGATNYLVSDSTGAETTAVNSLTAFNSNGFTLGNGSGVNTNDSGSTYVAWQWNANNGSTSSNTSGTITSTVSVNATAGFSVVTYTGTGANATVGHGLGVAPSWIITKYRGTESWAVYHKSTGNTQYLVLNSTSAAATASTVWQNTSPTSTVFSVGTAGLVNTSGGSGMVAYCWAEIAEFSKFGSYTGNGSDDGPFVYTGFRPKWIMVKRTDAAGESWLIIDTFRNVINVAGNYLLANSSNAEATYNGMDVLSNGFKIRSTSTINNTNGGTYIYAAFAENPFKNANAR
jgi:hypothetical protein